MQPGQAYPYAVRRRRRQASQGESVPTSLADVRKDRLLSKRPTSLKTVQPLNQNKSFAIFTNQDRRCLPFFQYALGNLRDF